MDIKLIFGDITEMGVDAIVNAANGSLRWGSGVCGAIFQKANGLKLQQECDKLAPVNTGDAVMTKGYDLKARYIIHAVGPIYSGSSKDPELLAQAYLNSLKLADEHNLKSIAFPSISTGIYGYPKEEACQIAIKTVKEFVPKSLELVIFVCFVEENYRLYQKYL